MLIASNIMMNDLTVKNTPKRLKRKLKAPIASLSDKQFLLTTPLTNNKSSSSLTSQSSSRLSSLTSSSSSFPILNRQNLTYTPMTRKLLQKQQQFAYNKYKPIIPSISLTKSSFPTIINANVNNHNKRKKKKKIYRYVRFKFVSK
eukprot:828143_1